MKSSYKVLIVDDEFIMRQGMKHMLEWEKEGFEIVGEASNGREGLQLVEKLSPDIVFADIVMPVLDGIEFSKILQEKYPEIKLIILSSYDKFAYVKSALLNGAVDYILKPTLNPEDLLKVLKKISKDIPGVILPSKELFSYEHQMEKFLLGYEEKLEENIFAECFPHSLYRITGISLKNIYRNQSNKISYIQEILEDFFEDGKSYKKLAVVLREEELCCILNYRVKDKKQVLEDIELCVEKLSQVYEQIFVVVGGSFSNMQDIREKYNKELVKTIKDKFYYPDKQLLFLEDKRVEHLVERFNFEEYSNLLSKNHFQQALVIFQEYLIKVRESKLDEYKIKNLAKNLLYNYLMEIEKYDVESEELRLSYFSAIDNTTSIYEYNKVIDEIVLELEELEGGRNRFENLHISEIKKYINDHHNESLTLLEIANHFSFNYYYFSTYFSEHTKEGFSEYLNKVRIEKACQLLDKRENSIAHISSEVGYTDHSYFCRVFKKITGYTPSVYKRRKSGT